MKAQLVYFEPNQTSHVKYATKNMWAKLLHSKNDDDVSELGINEFSIEIGWPDGGIFKIQNWFIEKKNLF